MGSSLGANLAEQYDVVGRTFLLQAPLREDGVGRPGLLLAGAVRKHLGSGSALTVHGPARGFNTGITTRFRDSLIPDHRYTYT